MLDHCIKYTERVVEIASLTKAISNRLALTNNLYLLINNRRGNHTPPPQFVSYPKICSTIFDSLRSLQCFAISLSFIQIMPYLLTTTSLENNLAANINQTHDPNPKTNPYQNRIKVKKVKKKSLTKKTKTKSRIWDSNLSRLNLKPHA